MEAESTCTSVFVLDGAGVFVFEINGNGLVRGLRVDVPTWKQEKRIWIASSRITFQFEASKTKDSGWWYQEEEKMTNDNDCSMNDCPMRNRSILWILKF
jgi:hypothetical protein